MMKRILGIKKGMTSVFAKGGQVVPVTVIHCQPNLVTAVKTKDRDNYDALQLAIGSTKLSKLNKPDQGQYKKNNLKDIRKVKKEARGMTGYTQGDYVKNTIFTAGEFVDVTGQTKGRGFSGVIKRWNQKIGPKGHGGGYPHRLIGSLNGARGGTEAQRVWKGRHMPGRYGNEKVTIQNLEIISVDAQNEVLLVKGAIPGPVSSVVLISTAVKKHGAHEKIELVNIIEEERKNDLLEDAKKYNLTFTPEMSLEQMADMVNEARAKEEAEKALVQKADEEKLAEKTKAEEQNAKPTTEQVATSEDTPAAVSPGTTNEPVVSEVEKTSEEPAKSVETQPAPAADVEKQTVSEAPQDTKEQVAFEGTERVVESEDTPAAVSPEITKKAPVSEEAKTPEETVETEPAPSADNEEQTVSEAPQDTKEQIVPEGTEQVVERGDIPPESTNEPAVSEEAKTPEETVETQPATPADADKTIPTENEDDARKFEIDTKSISVAVAKAESEFKAAAAKIEADKNALESDSQSLEKDFSKMQGDIKKTTEDLENLQKDEEALEEAEEKLAKAGKEE